MSCVNGVQVRHDDHWERRDVLGVHPQKQPGLCWVGACVPAGRLHADDFDVLARIAEVSERVTTDNGVL